MEAIDRLEKSQGQLAQAIAGLDKSIDRLIARLAEAEAIMAALVKDLGWVGFDSTSNPFAAYRAYLAKYGK